MRRSGLPVLTYHAIDAGGGVIATDPSWFAETLDALARGGLPRRSTWTTGSRGAAPTSTAGSPWPSTTACGRSSRSPTSSRATGVPATVFLVTDRDGPRQRLAGPARGRPQRAAARRGRSSSALAAPGFRFAAHGADPRPARPLLRRGRSTASCAAPATAIEQRLGRPCPLLAYPYGARSPRVRRRGRAALRGGLRHAARPRRRDAGPLHDLSRIDAYYLRSRRALDAPGLRPLARLARGVRRALAASVAGARPSLDRRACPRSAIGDRSVTDDSKPSAVATDAWSVRPAAASLDAAAGRVRACGCAPGLPGRRRPARPPAGIGPLPRPRTPSGEGRAAARGRGPTDLAGLAAAYYAMTDDVLDHRRGRFLRHIAGAERGARRWRAAAARGADPGGRLRDRAACSSPRRGPGRRSMGVDIAARWLVVARRRLADHGLSVAAGRGRGRAAPLARRASSTRSSPTACSSTSTTPRPRSASGSGCSGRGAGSWSGRRTGSRSRPTRTSGLWGLGWLPAGWVPGYLRLRGRTTGRRGRSRPVEARRLAPRRGLDEVEVGVPAIPAALGADAARARAARDPRLRGARTVRPAPACSAPSARSGSFGPTRRRGAPHDARRRAVRRADGTAAPVADRHAGRDPAGRAALGCWRPSCSPAGSGSW